MDSEPLKHAFWAIVTDCLQAFHNFERDEAVLRVAGYRESIENPPLEQLPPAGYDADLIFHEEPFYLASDLAGEELELAEYRNEYERIVAARYGPAEVSARMVGDRLTRSV
ncbi:MAG TPA: hypothetical protein VGB24_00630 [Longimicrobium sp.]|jgi:hypothetical protein|uniref:hypothetical protein n=1 Tax=Longimicrobium sp. TaxID=2029185 RepID=UPI002ED86147